MTMELAQIELFNEFTSIGHEVLDLKCFAQNSWEDFPLDQGFIDEWSKHFDDVLERLKYLKETSLKVYQSYKPGRP